eukprot:GILI01005581.1.p1 GENE.GILI01005581.1~~GILI01005581.1.p1  ORF type:complete len:678 (+),score=217.29 GILI01005581.1:48-2036(+)
MSRGLFVVAALGVLCLASVFAEEIDDRTWDRCTTITVGAKASVDGSTITTHTNDCHQCDSRVMRVPAADWPEGSQRPVYMAENMEYPRYVGYSRGPAYEPAEGQKVEEPIGYIPQVAHTYAYFDGSYGIMNEHQVAIGESTCAAKIWAKPVSAGGHALFDMIELTKVTLERAKTAREAVKILTNLAETYGYYSNWMNEATAYFMAGETVTIIDPKESWVVNMLASPDGKGAIWAARRVPDDEVAVTANYFTICELDLSNPDYYMASSNVFDVAREKGWWKDGEKFCFVKAYVDLEKDLPKKDYWITRMWRVYDVIAPSLKLSPYVRYVTEMPFSVKPDAPVSAQTIMMLNRDVYEGTQFDLTRGAGGGAWGSPMRHDGMSASQRAENITGVWARAISLARTSYSTVLQARGWLPDPVGGVFWMGEDAPHSTVYIPFFAGAEDTAKSFRTGSLHKFTRESAWWAFDFVSNWIELRWKVMIVDVRSKIKEVEDKQAAAIKDLEERAVAAYKQAGEGEAGKKAAAQLVSQFTSTNAEEVVKTWWEFADYLVAKYNDGYVNFPKVGGTTGYEAWWLKSVGYDNDPRAKSNKCYTTAAKAFPPPPAANSLPMPAKPSHASSSSETVTVSTMAFVAVAIGLSSILLGFVAGRVLQKKQPTAQVVVTSF